MAFFYEDILERVFDLLALHGVHDVVTLVNYSLLNGLLPENSGISALLRCLL